MTYVPQNKRNLVAAAAATGGTIEAAPAPTPAGHRRLPWARVTRRTLALAAVATALPVGVGAAVIVLSGERPAPERPLPVLGAGPDGRVIDRSPLPRPATSLLDAFSRLGRPPTAEDRDNGAVVRWAANAKRFGADPDASRIMTTIDGKRLWLIPGNGFVCLGVQPLGTDLLETGCNTEAAALRDGVNVNVSGNAGIFGLLPDGIDKIEVTDDDGFRHVEPVTDNAYLLKNAGATIRYPFGTAGGIEMFRVIGTSPSG